MTIENIVVNYSHWIPEDLEVLFDGEAVHFTEARDIQSLMVEIGAFPSKSKALQAGRSGPIPSGWTDSFKANKKRRVWIWNPDETVNEG